MAAPTTRTGAFAELLEHNAVATVFAKLGGGMIKFKFHFQTELNIPCESPWRGHAEYTHEHASTPQDTQDNITNIANLFFLAMRGAGVVW